MDFGAGRDDTRLGAGAVFTPLGGFYSPSAAARHFPTPTGKGIGSFAASPVFTPLGGIWYRLIVGMETLQATSLHVSFCRSAVVLSEQPPSGVVTGLAKTERAHKFCVVPLGGASVYTALTRKKPSSACGGRWPKVGRGG